MKRVVDFWKKYSIFALLIIPVIYVSFGNRLPNSDIWFVLTLGRYATTKGIPMIEPFTIHEGLSYVMQQWGAASIMWKVFDWFGSYGLLVLIFIVLLILMILFYNLCRQSNKSRFISTLLTTLVFYFIGRLFIVQRPHIFTFVVLLVELLLLEKYSKTNNWKYLIGLPILSIIQINLHVSMWYFLFLFILPYIANAIYIKGITIDKIKLKPLLLVLIPMLVGGLINPYGINAILFIFKSYGIDLINERIIEMQAPSLSSGYGNLFVIANVLLFVLILMQRYVKKFKLDVRHICLILGTYILYISHLKCFPYFIFAYFYGMSYGLKDVKFPSISFKYWDQLVVIIKRVFNAALCMLIVTFFVVTYLVVKSYQFIPSTSFVDDEAKIADFIIDNYDVNEVSLYNPFEEGGYYMFRGIKVYVDGRIEVYFKKGNGVYDYFEEAMKVEDDFRDFDYAAFVNKYKFTHILVIYDSNFDRYLRTNDNYEIVYVSGINGDENNPYRYLYALKDNTN